MYFVHCMCYLNILHPKEIRTWASHSNDLIYLGWKKGSRNSEVQSDRRPRIGRRGDATGAA